MATNAGVWIDHRQALVLFLSEAGEEIKVIESNVEELARSSKGSSPSKPYGTQHMATGDRHERQFYEHLNSFYNDVIQSLGSAEKILLMGPGEAKGEFHKRIKSKEMQQRIVGVETADKMTQPQFAVKVREFFREPDE